MSLDDVASKSLLGLLEPLQPRVGPFEPNRQVRGLVSADVFSGVWIKLIDLNQLFSVNFFCMSFTSGETKPITDGWTYNFSVKFKPQCARNVSNGYI